jgi:hypothetical protein
MQVAPNTDNTDNNEQYHYASSSPNTDNTDNNHSPDGLDMDMDMLWGYLPFVAHFTFV